MPAADLDLIARAAREGGAAAMRFWRQNPGVQQKPGGQGPVSEADLAVDALVSARLRAVRPAYGWLSEETPDDPARLGCARVFIVDPIDGTRAFLAGEPDFAVSIAVAEHGVVTAAAVYLPARDTLYTAAADGPALCDGREIRAATGAGSAEGASVLTAGPTLAADNWPGGVPGIRRAFRPSLALRLCLVADGRHDGMMTLRDAWEWDIAAGALIAARAGAMVSDRHGALLRFNAPHPQAPGVLAAGPALHGDLIARLRPRPASQG